MTPTSRSIRRWTTSPSGCGGTSAGSAIIVPIVYISQDGGKPSGITTYGCQVLDACPDAVMVLLNADQLPPTVWPEVAARVFCIAENESHEVAVVARRLAEVVARMTGNVTLLPNTGDTSWSATVEYLRSLAPADREHLRVLGIVHSDAEAQYAGAVTHAILAAAWIGVSRRCAEELRRRLAGGTRPVYELLCPMPLPPRSAVENRSGPLRLVYAGRLEEPQKRVSRLAGVIARLTSRGIDFTAAIVGDGPARAALRECLAGAAGERVTWHGTVGRDALADILSRSDVFMLTSAYEGLPLALLEAMAAGLCPVVMQTESGLDDVIATGRDGIVVAQGDVDAMADAIVRLSEDREELERLKRSARDRVRRAFSPERYRAQLSAILATCRASPAPDPGVVANDQTAAAVRELVTRTRATARPAVVYGMGMFGRKVIDACLDGGVPIVGAVDSDPGRVGQVYRGLSCRTPSDLTGWKDAAVVIGSLAFAEEMAERVVQVFTERALAPPPVIKHPA